MSTTFQPGDRIRCVDPYATELVRGRIYTVVTYQIAVDTAGLADPGLVYIRRNGRAEGYRAERFLLVEKAKPRFKPGDRVKVIRGMGNLLKDEVYTVFSVSESGMLRLLGRHLETFLPFRFSAAEPERKISSPSRPRVVGQRINPGDTVVFLEDSGTLKRGQQYVVDRVKRRRHNPWQQDDKIWVVGEGDNKCGHWAYRFGLVKQAELDLAFDEPASLDEYGPAAPEPPHPVHRTIQQRFPRHPSDIARSLNELRADE